MKVRWGHVSELDRRLHVGTPAWREMPRRLRHLSAWRRLHTLDDHHTIHRAAARIGVRPSSNLKLRDKVSLVKLREQIKRQGG